MRNYARMVTFAATLAWRHIRAEPARVPLLTFRLLPASALRPALWALRRLGPLGRVHALWGEGRRAEALAAVRHASHTASSRQRARLAAFAIAAEHAELAHDLVATLPEGKRHARLRHRLALKTGRAVRAPGRPSSTTPVPLRRTRRYAPVNTRVLHLVTNALPHTNAGYTQRTHHIAVGQRRAGLDPHVLTRVGFPVSGGVLDPRHRVELDGISYHRMLPWLAPADERAELRAGLRLASPLVERLRPAVLHAASDYRNAELALELGRRHGLPVVYEVRGFLEESWLSRDPGRSVSDPFYVERRARETACMRQADLVVTLGEAMRDEIIRRGVDPANVLVVPNAVAESFLEPLPDASEVRAELGIGRSDFVVGTTTSCYGYEGLDTLLAAVARLRVRGIAAHALIVGDGPELAALREQAAGLADAGDPNADPTRGASWAHFPGRVPASEIRRYHAALDVFAVPRRDDRVCRLVTPLKPVEAMAGGLPVVASDLAALSELVEPGVTGELIPPDDYEALSSSLERLFYARTRRERIGRAARERVREDRTWSAAAYHYSESYAELSRKLSASGHFRER